MVSYSALQFLRRQREVNINCKQIVKQGTDDEVSRSVRKLVWAG